MNDPAWQFELGTLFGAVGLLALPVIVLFARRSLVGLAHWRRHAWLAVRLLLAVLLAAALCRPVVRTVCHRLYVVLATDHSASVPDSARRQAAEFAAQAASLQSEHHAESWTFPEHVQGSAPGAADESNLARAVLQSRVRIPADRPGRIVLLSDGKETTGDVRRAAAGAGVPVDTVPLAGLPETETAVVALHAPQHVRQGETCSIEVVIRSNATGEGRLELLELTRTQTGPGAEGSKPAAVDYQDLVIPPGETRVRFAFRAAEQGWTALEAVLSGVPDTHAQNNRLGAVLRVLPPPRTLLLATDAAEDEPLVRALQADDLPVDVRSAEQSAEVLGRGPLPGTSEDQAQPDAEAEPAQTMPAQAGLAPYDLLILSGVPARLLGSEAMERIARFVQAGGGLLVIGGDQSLTPGGYHGTRLEELLPVECVPRSDKPKPALALLLVVDRSASMQGEKIALAREACRRAVEALGPNDEVGILVFEDRAEWLSPLGPSTDRQAVLERIDRLQPGGSTNLYPAMHRAYLALRRRTAELKHMIVLSDGISHPGPFAQLAREIAGDEITISTVAVGAESARELLKELAELGAGQYYYCDQPRALPQIFALEAARAGRTGITEEPFSPREPAGSNALAALQVELPGLLLGFAETRARPQAQTLLETPGAHPLLARWQVGQGTCVVFTSDVHQRWAAAWRREPGFARFWQAIARTALRPVPNPRARLRTVRIEGRHVAVVDWPAEQPGRVPDVRAMLHVEPGAQQSAMVAIGPRTCAAELPVGEGIYWLRAVIRWPDGTQEESFGGVMPGYAPEFAFAPEDRELLQEVAALGRGRYDPKPAEVFAPAATGVARSVPLGFWLALGGVLVVVADVVLKGWRFARAPRGPD